MIIDCPKFVTLSYLIDEAILCGNHDILPGIQGRKMINSNIEGDELPLLTESFIIMIDQISVKVPDSLENQLIKYAQNYRIAAYGKNTSLVYTVVFILIIDLNPDIIKNIQDVSIKERRFIAIFHNTWTAVNEKKYDNYITLIASKQQPGIYNWGGSFPLDSIFIDDYALICIQIDYVCNILV